MGKLRVNYKFGARTKDLNEAQKALRRDYKKAYDRVRKYYERHSEKDGYIDLPPMPTHPEIVTRAAVKKLERLTPERIEKTMRWFDRETGEILTAREKKARTRREAADKRKGRKGGGRGALPPLPGALTYEKMWRSLIDQIDGYINGLSAGTVDHYRRVESIQSDLRRLKISLERIAVENGERVFGNLEKREQKAYEKAGYSALDFGHNWVGYRLDANWDEIQRLMEQIVFSSQTETAYNAIEGIIDILESETGDTYEGLRSMAEMEDYGGFDETYDGEPWDW